MTRPSAPPREELITGEELERMPDLGPCELVEGRIVPMSPAGGEHGGIEMKVAAALNGFVEQRRLGRVLVGEVGIYTGRNPDTVRGADVLYISNERFARVTRRAGFLDVAPELVVEVLSPTDKAVEVTQKLKEYFAAGVVLVWLVNPKLRAVYVHRSLTDVREFKEGEEVPGDEVLPGFALPVAGVFAD